MASISSNGRLYQTLCRVLDSIRAEAPAGDAKYNPPPGNHDAVIQARSRALLHLFLKAKFGQTDFAKREKLVTEGQHDGGIDAYFIDTSTKKIYVLQSKFRATATNFTSTNMTPDDLLKMQVGRVVKGERYDESGPLYNEKILKGLQKSIQKLPDAGSYTIQVVLLGNTRKFSPFQLKKLVEGYEVDQYHHDRIYHELMFPVINGTYFSDPNLTVEISLDNVTKGASHLDYDAKTASIKVNIRLLFAPTKEIGRVMSMYRNSILKFNPRSFLELAKNSVNLEIEQSILKKDNNEFSLYNNGITIISDRTAISSDTAKHGTAQLILTNPQLVNGGQTAYVLGRIYEDCVSKNSFKALKGKEVLLRVITFSVVPELKNLGTRLRLISDISKASNSQTKIEEADRRSGDEIQIRLQEDLFKEFGIYYERKKGEFSDGIRDGYIDANQLVSREDVIRVALAANYQIKAIRSGIARYFQESQLSALLKMKDVNKYGYGSEVLQLLGQLQKAKPAKKGDRYHVDVYGQAFRFGLNSVLAVCINVGLHTKVPADLIVPTVLAQWRDFDFWAANQPANAIYLGGSTPDLGAYYRGSTLEGDIQTYPGFLIT